MTTTNEAEAAGPERIWIDPDELDWHEMPGTKGTVEYIRAPLAAVVSAGPTETQICDAIETAINQYRCQYWVDGDDPQSGLELVDVFTPEGHSSIKTGKEEVALLVDSVCGTIVDLFRVTPPSDRYGEGLEAAANEAINEGLHGLASRIRALSPATAVKEGQ